MRRLRSKKLGHSKEPVGRFYRLCSRGATTVGAVGQSVSIDAEAYQVVGVLPRGTTWLGLDAYEPLVLSPERSRSDHRWQVLARLREELGVGIALGASGGEVVALVMRQGMVPAVLGIGAGLVATMGVSRPAGRCSTVSVRPTLSPTWASDCCSRRPRRPLAGFRRAPR